MLFLSAAFVLLFRAPAHAEKLEVTPIAADEVVAVALRYWPPQYGVDEKGNATGFSADAMREIAKRAGIQVRYRFVDNFPAAYALLAAGEADLIPNLGIIPTREIHGRFTAPLETFPISVFTRRDSTGIGKISDLRGKKVGVVRTNIGMQLVKKMPDVYAISYDGPQSAFFDLIAGQLDAVIYPRPVLMNVARKLGLERKIVALNPPLHEVKRGILVRHDKPVLWRKLDVAVQEFVGTRAYRQIYSSWYGKPDPPFDSSLAIWLICGVAFVGVAGSFAWRYISVARLNKRLVQQAAMLDTVLDHVDQGISLFDADLKTMVFNKRFAELLNLPANAQRPGMAYEEILRIAANRVGQSRAAAEEYIHTAVDVAKKAKPRRTLRKRPDGTTIDVRANPIPGGGMVATYTDITEQTRVEDALRTSEQQLSEAQRLGRIGHWRYFPNDHRFDCSEAFYEIYGWDPENFIPTYAAITAAVHPEDRKRLSALRKDAGDNRSAYTCEFRIVRSDGSVRYIRGEGRPQFDECGKLLYFFGVNQDVTEQKRAEEEMLRERSRAELANRAKSEFLANMSHEIRTPLNAIIGFTDIMGQQVFGPIENERYAQYIEDIHSSAGHLLELVNDILDISTIEAGEMTLSPTVLNLGDVFEECDRFVGEQARKAGLSMDMQLPHPTMAVFADQRALRQILLNLLSNAIKFTRPGGQITVSAEETDERLSICVTDTGIGIPTENLSRIMQPFETGSGDPHTRNAGNPFARSEGTGLGLAIVRSLANLHGGGVEIESDEGQGTVVKFWFPKKRLAAA